MAGSSSSAWAALSHLPRGPFSGPPKTMTPAQMLAPLPAATFPASSPTTTAAAAAAAEWDDARDAAASAAGDGAADGGAPRPAQPRFIEHRLEKRDTLLGLSLRYGVSAAELRLANDMPQSSDNLSACGPMLRVPAASSGRAGAPGGRPAGAPEAESARAVLRRFRVAHALSEAEAKYYLSLCDGDFNAASRELAQDLEVERRLGGSGAAAAAASGGGGDGGSSGPRPAAPATLAPPAAGPRAASKLSGEGAALLNVEDGEEEEEGSCGRPGSALRKRR